MSGITESGPYFHPITDDLNVRFTPVISTPTQHNRNVGIIRP